MIKNLPSLLLILFIGGIISSCGDINGKTAERYKMWLLAAEKYEAEYNKMKVGPSSNQEAKDKKKHKAAKIAYC
ncbi:MAG: hypothetical protein KDC92_11955, partial [Bacteroidetes bacterium]|nr:hypothetical protein [Bacteroidota bacterium]